MITQTTFNQTVKQFDKQEKRTDFFALASNLIRGRFEIEAYVLLLATWNFARFRYAVKQFDLNSFSRTVKRLNKQFSLLKNQSIDSVDLSKHKKPIVAIFKTLSTIKGVEFTGAPKLMHLKNPKLFVMWDDYIRGERPKKYYDKLNVVKNGIWTYERYPKNPDGYVRFLKDMQCRFGHLKSPSNLKTLAKAIDEFNYVSITLPIQKMEKKK